MFKSVLVANRAEIACRIFRTARAMSITTVAVYSDADAKAKHVREADDAVHIGASAAAESYLRGDKIIAAAKQTGAEAIHPGYGFLSENPSFAQSVIDAGLIWIGPTPDAIRAMGLKDEAKRIAEEAGVPVVPGYRGEAQDVKTLVKAAKDVGFPVLIKAIAGGGGRGIREVTKESEFAGALESAKREAAAAFGDDRVIVEKLIERPRHIEVQVFGDKHGNLVHLFERDCSLQRRRQKVIEEAPAPGMTEEVRTAMTDAALKVARAVNYENAGTVEYVVDGTGPLRPDGFWFLEMNTRLQVEHPVTEAVTGLDLVEWQFRVAAGEKLPKAQEEIALNGHAIEARLCAEEPSEGFRPSVGRISRFMYDGHTPRMDRGFDVGDGVSASYDSLIIKAIQFAATRDNAIAWLWSHLDGLQVLGIRTNAAFMRRCLEHPDFCSGKLHTGLIGENSEALVDSIADVHRAAILMANWDLLPNGSTSPWSNLDGWRLNSSNRHTWRFEYRDAPVALELIKSAEGDSAKINGAEYVIANAGIAADRIWMEIGDEHETAFVGEYAGARVIFYGGEAYHFSQPGASREHADTVGGDTVKAPLPGKVVAIAAKLGASVKKGEPLITLEAMKMEHALKAPRDGVIAEITVSAGAQVKEGAVLVRLQEEEAA